MPTAARSAESVDHCIGLLEQADLYEDIRADYAQALRALAGVLEQDPEADTFKRVVFAPGNPRRDKILQGYDSRLAASGQQTASDNLIPAVIVLRSADPATAKQLAEVRGLINDLLAKNTDITDETRENYSRALLWTAELLIYHPEGRTIEQILCQPEAADTARLERYRQYFRARGMGNAARYLVAAVRGIHAHHTANQSEPGPSEVNNDPAAAPQLTAKDAEIITKVLDEKATRLLPSLRQICAHVLHAVAKWLDQNPELPSFSTFIAATVLRQNNGDEDALLDGDCVAEQDTFLHVGKLHLLTTGQTFACDHIFGVFDYLRGHSGRTSEIKATFDLGDGTYYRAWIDTVLPKLGAFVQANISPETVVVVYDQQGTRITAPPTEYSTPLVLRCDQHRHFDILEPPSEFNASEQIILPSDHTAISADGYQYKTKIDQDRISLFICLAEYNARGVFTRHSGRGLLEPGAGPDEVLARFDNWMTIVHPDLRSQLNAAADLAWLKIVATMLWAATNTEGNVDENLELLNNQNKALPEYAATSNAVRAMAGAIYRHCKAVVMHEEQRGDMSPINRQLRRLRTG